MPLNQALKATSNEAKVILALQALQTGQIKSEREAARVYNINRTTLRRRRAGIQYRRDTKSTLIKHTILEEQVLVNKVLDLDARGFPATYARLRDMANLLLTTRGSTEVGANWPAAFVKRRPELKTRFSRKYNQRQALCEDYTTIAAWFQLVQNVKAKYSILDKDTWNFNKTGFIMGVISSSLKVITGSEKRHKPKQIQQGNREWVSSIVGVSGAG
jgi:hypothetical protein